MVGSIPANFKQISRVKSESWAGMSSTAWTCCSAVPAARSSSIRDKAAARRANVELDTSKIDEAVLALLYLGLHDGARAWKGFDWEAMNRLHEQGYITDPRGKAKSVVFTEEGLERARSLLEKLFGKSPEPSATAERPRE